jgi:hypothetical protein
MSIVSEIERIKTNIANAYAKCEEKGATMPSVLNSANLFECIASITGGGTTPKYLNYYGLATNKSNDSGSLSASNIGNYMLFAGGTSSANNVDAYDDEMVKTTPTKLSQARIWIGSASNSNYVLLAGGNVGSDKCTAVVDTYDNSLVRGTATNLSVARQQVSGATAGDNILFGGGHASGVYATVDTYDANLVKGTITDLSVARSNFTATNIEGNALFCGGYSTSICNIVDAYNSDLVKVVVDNLTESRNFLSATHTKSYALVAGGEKTSSSYSDVVDVYDKNLVKRTPTKLSKARGRVGGADIGGFAVVFDGYAGYNVTTVEMFDDNLTRVQLPDTQYSRAWAVGASAGRYLYISGGTYEVDVYELVG